MLSLVTRITSEKTGENLSISEMAKSNSGTMAREGMAATEKYLGTLILLINLYEKSHDNIFIHFILEIKYIVQKIPLM